jgi:hypothetical protein
MNREENKKLPQGCVLCKKNNAQHQEQENEVERGWLLEAAQD